MTTMIERVARAIEEAALLQRVSYKAWGAAGGIIPPLRMDEIARAAIQAMREPTAGQSHFMTSVVALSEDPALALWQAMIDAALAEEPK